MDQSSEKRFRDILLDRVCDLRPFIWVVFGLCCAVFLLLLVSLVVVDSSSPTYPIIVVDLVSVVVIGIGSGILLRICAPNP